MKLSQFNLIVFFAFTFFQTAFSQCVGNNPNLGNDTSVCVGQSIVLSSAGTYNSYLWNNNSTQPTRSVNQPGTYWLQTGVIGNNLIVNGDFEAGNTGFVTDYVIGTGGNFGQLSLEGTYAITSSPSAAHSNFNSCSDHTPTPGTEMMVVNGSGNSNTKVWCQTMSVSPNTDYQFSTWASSALNDANVAQLQFSINSSTLGAVFSPPSTGCSWTQFSQNWNSGIQTNAQICIVNQNIGISGNDFMIDDISFAPICYERDTIVVSAIPSPVITVTPNDTICVGELSNIVASSVSSNLTYTWNPGSIVSNTLNVSPAASAFYNVNAVDVNGCVSNLVSRLVKVQVSPTVNLQHVDTICAGNQVSITANTTGTNLTYTWNPNLSTTNVLVDSPQNSQSYTVKVTNPIGCSAFDTANVYVIPQLVASISGDLLICDDGSTVLSVSGNQANMNFIWSNGSVGNSINVDANQVGEYSVIGSFQNCPTAFDTVVVSIQPTPQLSLPSDFVICPGEQVSATATSTTAGAVFNWLNLSETGNTQLISMTDNGYIYVTAQVGNCVSPVDSFYIEVMPICDFEIPNVFTPNGDNSNEFFQLVSFDGIKTLTCVILNRWGNTIASFDKPNFAWDGTDGNGHKVADGTYFYIIEATTFGEKSFKEQGIVQLVR